MALLCDILMKELEAKHGQMVAKNNEIAPCAGHTLLVHFARCRSRDG
jgi:hypothetical protein